ncbi:MAG: sigma-70 family RNA polymerase sigma factor [Phycisphaeraceae bacterium]|nr:sigma-70 family RNA polymerase sigma factor [Phycisphaeraceae bacterium]
MLSTIAELTETERLVLIMHWGDRCTIDEMASVLARDRGEISAIVHRVREIVSEAVALTPSICPAGSPDQLR